MPDISKDGVRELKDDDILSRFVKIRHYDEKRQTISTAVFFEDHEKGFSTFRTNGLVKTQIQAICLTFVSQGKEKLYSKYCGSWDASPFTYKDYGFTIEKNEKNSPRHYDVWGFPFADELEEVRRIQQAQLLADAGHFSALN